MVNSDDIKQNLGKNLKNLRIAKGLSQEKLAEFIGLERETISSMEVGRAFTSSEVLAAFSNFFTVEPSYFLKSNFIEQTQKIIDIKKAINCCLADCDESTLQKYYNILISLKD